VHRAAAQHAAAAGISLSVEPLNRFECYLMNTVAAAAAMVDAVGMPNYGILYDTFHANIEEKAPVGVIAPHLSRINHVHLSENDRGTPGKGHIPFLATLSALRAGGYDGWCVIEAFGRALPEIAAATRVWRDFFPSDEEVVRSGHDFLRATWAEAGPECEAEEDPAEAADMPPGLA
jgi:D-psicose/D-tagatose/L-ribulose 3-epimerase